MVALNISVRLDENFVIDNSLHTVTPVTTSTVLYRMDIWLLRRQNLKEYAILIYPWYQQIYIRPIYRPTSELYRYDGIPLRRHVDHSISDIYRPTTLANINEITPFRCRFNKGNAMLDRHIDRYQIIWIRSNSAENTISTIRCQKSDFNTGAEIIRQLWYRFDIIILMWGRYSNRCRIDIDTM